MNLRTADRFRLTIKLFHVLLTISTLWIAVVTGRRLNSIERRVAHGEELDKREIRALFVIGDAIDHLLQTQPGPHVPLPPLTLPPLVPQNNFYLKTRTRGHIK